MCVLYLLQEMDSHYQPSICSAASSTSCNLLKIKANIGNIHIHQNKNKKHTQHMAQCPFYKLIIYSGRQHENRVPST